MSIAVSNSPVFSPSSNLFCNKTDTLTITRSGVSSPSSLSPSSPFRLRLQKPLTGLSSSSYSSKSTQGSGSVGVRSEPSPALLKRKRPARLDIPVATISFGGTTTPCEERREMEREGSGYSVFCKKGRREAMEDRYSALVDVHGDPKQALFGVFDGHGGAKAAEFAAENLNKYILDEVVRRDEDKIDDAVKNGYLNMDAQFLKEDLYGGACVVSALIRKGHLIVSNAGDCRAVMSIGGVAEALTSDHRPSRKDERDRIETLGGYVDLRRGVWRIQGSLAVSRGIGDQHLKKWVVAEPETKILKIRPEHEFLILASDGLWDKVTNQEAIDIARPLCTGVDKPEPLAACKLLANVSVSRGSSDDISVMLIQLGRFI
ncbi:PP2C domain-containing protein, partial [Cephalotus follicularis]